MTDLHIDIESKSRVDLIKCGLDRYSADPSTRVLMMGWAIDDEPPAMWFPGQPVPPKLKAAFLDKTVVLWAHNAQFERVMLQRVLGMKLAVSRWRCTQIMCYYAGLAGKLEDAGQIVGLGDDLAKLATDGRRLIRKFCVPRTPTAAKPYEWHTEKTDPDDWQLFVDYCARDVVAERALANKLKKFAPPPFIWDEYVLDQKINDAGMPVDVQMAQEAVRAAFHFKRRGVRDLAKRTGLANPMSNTQALPWLQERGYPFSDLRKQTVAKAAALEPSPMTPEAAEIVVARSELNKASVKKYDALLNRAGKGDRLRYNFQYLGAMRTGRFAGRAVQLQNLARPAKAHEDKLGDMREALREGDIEELLLIGGGNLLGSLSSLLRPVFAAPKGKILRVADLSSIEDRKVAWLAGCDTILREHREGLDPYKAFGVHLYNKPYADLTKAERNNSKPGRLGCCYRLSAGRQDVNKNGDEIKTGLWGYAESMGIALTQEECAAAVRAYRNAYPEIVQHWYDLEAAVQKTITTRKPVQVQKVVFDVVAPYLRCRLPSGRYLHYLRPKLEDKEFTAPDGSKYRKTAISYEGSDPVTKKWGTIYTHGGKLLENICQASARDVLVFQMGLVDADGFEIVGHVHDEIITLQDEDDDYHTVTRLEELMSVAPDWCLDLPLGAAGYESSFYRKD